jgi:hypothetical protein
MKVTPRRRITATSALNEISTDQLENTVVVREEALPLYSRRLLDRDLKTT